VLQTVHSSPSIAAIASPRLRKEVLQTKDKTKKKKRLSYADRAAHKVGSNVTALIVTRPLKNKASSQRRILFKLSNKEKENKNRHNRKSFFACMFWFASYVPMFYS
jgi:hypothetical protein